MSYEAFQNIIARQRRAVCVGVKVFGGAARSAVESAAFSGGWASKGGVKGVTD